GRPFAQRDLAFVAAALNTDRAAFLLAAAHALRERVVRRSVIERRGRLVIPAAPRLAAVQGNDRALVRGQRDDVRIVRIEPRFLVVIAARRTAEPGERLAAVG